MKKRSGAAVEALDGDDPFPGDRQFVGALYRGLEILRCFRPADGPLGNQELAQRCGLPKATVSRLTYTLSKLGYLVHLEDTGRYRMGAPVLGLGYACLAGLRIRETAQPWLQELADYAGDGVLTALGGRDEFSMIYIACARSAGMISLQLNVGSRISLARSSMGRAYLAGLREAEPVRLDAQAARARGRGKLAAHRGRHFPRRRGDFHAGLLHERRRVAPAGEFGRGPLAPAAWR